MLYFRFDGQFAEKYLNDLIQELEHRWAFARVFDGHSGSNSYLTQIKRIQINFGDQRSTGVHLGKKVETFCLVVKLGDNHRPLQGR